jgi:hypothetical protein
MDDISTEILHAPKEFVRLYKLGRQAAKRGAPAEAHELFRRAIEIDPYHEQVWLWLATVVDSDEDRRVCYENVLELNPDSTSARLQLARLAEASDDAREKSGRGPWWRRLRGERA